MEAKNRESRRVAIIANQQEFPESSTEVITAHLEGASPTTFDSIEGFINVLEETPFDLVILFGQWQTEALIQFLYQMKTIEDRPSVIVVSPVNDGHTVSDLYRHGCQRYVIMEEHWPEELGMALRHVLRERQLQEAYVDHQTKLTEANRLLHERNQRLDEFAATVAHDIRGPLGGIAMRLDYLLNHHKHSLDERSEEIVERALQSSERLLDVLGAMHDYARLGSEAAIMDKVELSKLVEEVANDLPLNESLDVRIGIDTLPNVWGNSNLLRRVFLNLLTNAIKYNDKHEVIVNVGFDGEMLGSLARFGRIFVEDNGPGIPAEDHQSIFQMFKRGSSNGSTDGTGLGLAVVRRIIDLHFGDVMVASDPKWGTRFTLTLPLESVEFAR